MSEPSHRSGVVALLGRLPPIGLILASLLMALLYMGGEMVQIEMGLPLALTGLFQGMLLFFLLACDVLIGYRIRINKRTSAGHLEPVLLTENK